LKRPLALLVFAAAWLAFAVALVPMRWLGELSVWRNAGVSASGATGTIWNGQLLDVAMGSNVLGTVDAGLSAVSLLGGTAVLALRSDAGGAELRLGRERGLRKASGQWLGTLESPVGPLQLALSLDEFTAMFRAGSCFESGGNAQVQLAARTAPADWPTLVLSGTSRCREGVVEASLNPAPGSPAVELLVQAKADGSYRLTWTARSPDAALLRTLEALGFSAGPSGMSRVDEGRLGSRPAGQK
jgi:hypothetical protein